MTQLIGLLSLLSLVAVFGMAFTDTGDSFEHYQSPGGKLKSIDGGIIASATLIAPAGYQTRVSGTTAIDTIQLPYDGFEGTIVLIPTGVFTWTTNANIAIAGTAVVSKALHMTYSQRTSKWYPSYLS
jgi:hypothetical protein